MKENKKLIAEAIEKVYFAGEGSFCYNREFLLRKNHDDYAQVVKDKVKYTIYELATSKKSENKYGLLGKCLVNKSVHYTIAELTEPQVSDFLIRNGQPDIYSSKKDKMFNFLNILINSDQRFKSHFSFVEFVREHYEIELKV